MTFELSVNLEYMFHDAGDRIEDRMAAAAAAGFAKVEMFTTAGREVTSLRRAMDDHGLTMWTMVNDPRTQLVLTQTHDDFRSIFGNTLADAVALGCRQVVVASGPAVPYMKRAVQLQIVADAIASVVPMAEDAGVTILLEAVNTRVDHPGVLFGMTEDTVAVARLINSPSVRLLYDMYHSIVEGEEPAQVLPPIIDLVSHIQIADAPGRGEPGSGTIDWPERLGLLRRLGYVGAIGIECSPTRQPTAEALAYIRSLAAA